MLPDAILPTTSALQTLPFLLHSQLLLIIFVAFVIYFTVVVNIIVNYYCNYHTNCCCSCCCRHHRHHSRRRRRRLKNDFKHRIFTALDYVTPRLKRFKRFHRRVHIGLGMSHPNAKYCIAVLRFVHRYTVTRK